MGHQFLTPRYATARPSVPCPSAPRALLDMAQSTPHAGYAPNPGCLQILQVQAGTCRSSLRLVAPSSRRATPCPAYPYYSLDRVRQLRYSALRTQLGRRRTRARRSPRATGSLILHLNDSLRISQEFRTFVFI